MEQHTSKTHNCFLYSKNTAEIVLCSADPKHARVFPSSGPLLNYVVTQVNDKGHQGEHGWAKPIPSVSQAFLLQYALHVEVLSAPKPKLV